MTDPLLADASPWSAVRPDAWRELARDPAWNGAILKTSEGHRAYDAWLGPHWRAVGAASDRQDWLRGGYHFAIMDGRGREQADVCLDAIERAGGWFERDLFVTVDAEEGSGNHVRVAQLGRAVVEDTVDSFSARVLERTGRPTILYAGWWLRSIGVTSRMGCEWLWMASYTRTLQAATYGAMGWDPSRLLLWQYDGSQGADGVLAGYPTRAPITGGESVDVSVLTMPGGVEALRRVLWAERPAPDQRPAPPAASP